MFLLSTLCVADEVDLSLRLQKGMAWTSKVVQRFSDLEANFPVQEDKYEVKWKVLEESDAGYLLETSTRLTGTVLDSTLLPGPKDAAPLVEKFKMSFRGSREAPKSAPEAPMELRVDRALWFRAPADPVKIGDSWKTVSIADPSGLIPEATVRWSYVSNAVLNDRKVAVIHSEFSEKGNEPLLKANGQFYIDVETGISLKAKIGNSKFPIPGGEATLFGMELEQSSTIPKK